MTNPSNDRYSHLSEFGAPASLAIEDSKLSHEAQTAILAWIAYVEGALAALRRQGLLERRDS